MKVLVDGEQIDIEEIDSDYLIDGGIEYIEKNYGPLPELKTGYSGRYLDRFSYPVLSLDKGVYIFQVKYDTQADFKYQSRWNSYTLSYHYAPMLLTPIQSGKLEVDIIDKSENINWTFEGKPLTGDMKRIWDSDERPEYIIISGELPLPLWVKAIFTCTSLGSFIILAFILISIHFFSLYRYRKNHPESPYSWVALYGGIWVATWIGIILPFLLLIFIPIIFLGHDGLYSSYDYLGLKGFGRIFMLLGVNFLAILYAPFSLLLDWIIKKSFLLNKKQKAL